VIFLARAPWRDTAKVAEGEKKKKTKKKEEKKCAAPY